MKEYKITTKISSIVITDRRTGELCAEYRAQDPKSLARAWRRVLDAHLAQPGSTLGNYQW